MKSIFTIKCCVFLLTALLCSISFAQVGINTTTPNGILDVNSNNTGVVLPRLALSATNVMAPATNPKTGVTDIPVGTVIYNTATTSNAPYSVSPGMYVWDGAEWIAQFDQKQSNLYHQSVINFRTESDNGWENIPLSGTSFTPKYTGTYKIEVNVNEVKVTQSNVCEYPDCNNPKFSNKHCSVHTGSNVKKSDNNEKEVILSGLEVEKSEKVTMTDDISSDDNNVEEDDGDLSEIKKRIEQSLSNLDQAEVE